MDATFLSSWDQDLPQFAAINTNPAFPAPFAQCLAPPGSQPLPPAQLLNSAPAAWAAATSGSSPAPTSSTQVCFEAGAQAPLSWLPASSTTPRQSSGALPHFATPPRLAASSGAATRSQQPGMARLPPLPPRRPAHSSSHSSAGPDATLFTASTARTPPATATVDFSTHAEGLSAQHLHTYPGNALPAQLPSSSSVQSPVDFVLSVMSASIGGQATPALGMPQAVSAPCFPPAPLLRLPQTVVPGVQFPQRVPTNTPDGAAAESVGFFDASPRAFSQPGTMSAPHDVLAAGGARRVASASRVSQDSGLPDAGADFLYGTEPGQFLLSAQRRPLQRRPSEPGCSFGVGADHSLVLVTGETKYTSAIKRMREEDDVADKEGRPRTSAMRRLFPAESSAPRAHHVNRPAGSGPAADAQYLNPQAIRTTPASILDAAAAWQASRSLSSPGCGSVSAPGSAYTTLQSLESVTAEAGQMDSMPCVVTDVAGARATSHPRLCRRRATHDGALGFPPLSSVRAPPPGSSLNSVASTPCGQPQQRWQLPSTPRSVFGMAAACQAMAPPATAAPTEAGSVESMDDDDVPACDPVLATRGSCVLSTVGSAVCLLTAPEQALQVRSASPPPTMPPPPQAGAPSPAVPAVAPSILQFAAPVRTGRRGPLGSDAYSRTCPSTPRAGVREASNPFHDAPDGNSALIAALMLPPAPVVAAPALTPVLTPTDMGAAQLWSLQELAAKSLGRPAPPARDWHSREQDKTIRSACSSALASFFSERFQDQLRDQPAGAVFLVSAPLFASHQHRLCRVCAWHGIGRSQR